MSQNEITFIISNIKDSVYPFYIIAGTILVVMAGRWGFKKILALLSSHRTVEQQIMDREQRIYKSNDDKYS